MKEWLEDLKQGLKALSIYAAATRHANGLFWPRHYFIVNGICATECLTASLIVYALTGPLGPRVRRVLMCVPWLWYTWVHVDAAFGNIAMQWPGLYVEIAGNIFNKLIGQ
jgi:hypothetical protein